MTNTLVVVGAAVVISAALSLGSMGIFYAIRNKRLRRNRSRHGEADGAKLAKCEYIIEDDISNGREIHKLPALSYSRHETAPSNDFHYVRDVHVNIEPIEVDTSLKLMSCCQCQGDCSAGNCECSQLSQIGTYYDADGRLHPEYLANSCDAIRECNVRCKCNPKVCKNMVIQRGTQLRLVLFKTKTRGWGVRTLENIKRGSFVGVYSGELLSMESSQHRPDDTYLFNLSSTIIGSSKATTNETPRVAEPQVVAVGEQPIAEDDDAAGERLAGYDEVDNCDKDGQQRTETLETEEAATQVSGHSKECDQESYEEILEYIEEVPEESQPQQSTLDGSFICDAKFYGNFTRFVNHSCEPNVIGLRSFTNHQDTRFPYIAFFTNQDIQAGDELTLNYGDNYWLVKCKRDKVYCLCKRSNCRFTKKTLNQTLKQYDERRATGCLG